MSEERWVNELAKAVREEEQSGELPAELARPFNRDELAKLGDALAKKLPATATPGNVVSLTDAARARRRWTWVAAVGAPLAAAAAIAFYVGHTGAPISDLSKLPTYDLVVEASDGTSRGTDTVAPDSVVRRSPDGRLTLVLRPRDVSAQAKDARATAWVDASGAVHAWPVTVQQSDEGAFRVIAQGDALAKLPAGPVRVILLVADAAHMPSDDRSAERAVRGGAPGVQVLAVRVEVTR